MKFIFPKNYNFKPKLLGFIDYSTAILNVSICVFLFLFLNIFPISLYTKLFTLISICFPVFLLSIVGFNGEDFVFVFTYTIKFMYKQKLFFYSKN